MQQDDMDLTNGHVNMMVDTVIANLPVEELRASVRDLLALQSGLTMPFLSHVARYLERTQSATISFAGGDFDPSTALADLGDLQQRSRCWMGCGFGFKALRMLTDGVELASRILVKSSQDLTDQLAQLDGDIIQALTAIQKCLGTPYGHRPLVPEEVEDFQHLKTVLYNARQVALTHGREFGFERASGALAAAFQNFCPKELKLNNIENHVESKVIELQPSRLESFQIGNSTVPRIFTGLWQSSSPSWGAAPASKIAQHFQKYAAAGFTAFDMADHYGDAEILIGRFRNPSSFCATKYCVFEPITMTQEIVQANITERCLRIKSDKIQLLQFHWQFYEDPQYVKSLKWLQEDERIENLGLCNFDTQRMEEIAEAGINIATNQVQFSLVDLRPIYKMAEVCRKHNIKLLTYGSLCGGFLADSWLGRPIPYLFAENMTPSHRKYLGMINIWGGWKLFQELLTVLSEIGKKHHVSISNVAVRWLLDFDFVGAVIIGARMGVSEHTEDNLKTLEFQLDADDKAAIDTVLDKSQGKEVFNAMGDCGSEYRV